MIEVEVSEGIIDNSLNGKGCFDERRCNMSWIDYWPDSNECTDIVLDIRCLISSQSEHNSGAHRHAYICDLLVILIYLSNVVDHRYKIYSRVLVEAEVVKLLRIILVV